MLRSTSLIATSLSVLAVGCLGAGSSDVAESELREGSELDVALSGHAIDPASMLGTFDLVEGDAEHRRIIFMKEGTALACATPETCRPIDASLPRRRPFELHEVGEHRARYLVLRTSATDPTPFRVYAVEPSGDTWGFRELTRAGAQPTSRMRRLPCSESLYDESDADHACAFYQCKLDTAPSPDLRCSYLSDWGLPYCKKYFRTRFHDRAFGPRVRQCLQEAIRDGMESLSCHDLEEAAVRSHVDCYVASGYCALSLSDRLRIAREIEPEDLTLTVGRTFKRIERACAGANADDDEH